MRKRTSVLMPALLVGLAVVVVLGSSGAGAATEEQFRAEFATSSDFYGQFDYGYSGQNPWEWGNGTGEGNEVHWMGDHSMDCAAPTTQREVGMAGDRDKLDYSQLFWHCQPGGDPAKGHLMTGVNTSEYNIAWFAPKPAFTGITKVCWDINETDMSARKWTQVVFIDAADARRYPVTSGTEHPAGETGPFTPYRAASGGFDLGFVSPAFSDPNGVSTHVISGGLDGRNQTLAGFRSSLGLTPEWFQDGQFTTPSWGATTDRILGLTDKATRYKHCLENQPNGMVRLTQAIPGGSRTIDMPGQIPQDPTRVVFQDDNYNPPKDEYYDPSVLTWHWDNIEVVAASSEELPAPPEVAETPAPPPAGESDSVGGSDESALTSTGGTDEGVVVFVIVLSVLVLAAAAAVVFVLLRSKGPQDSASGDRTDATLP